MRIDNQAFKNSVKYERKMLNDGVEIKYSTRQPENEWLLNPYKIKPDNILTITDFANRYQHYRSKIFKTCCVSYFIIFSRKCDAQPKQIASLFGIFNNDNYKRYMFLYDGHYFYIGKRQHIPYDAHDNTFSLKYLIAYNNNIMRIYNEYRVQVNHWSNYMYFANYYTAFYSERNNA